MITVDINDPVLAALATAVTESGTGYNSGAAVELNLDLHEHYVKCFIE